MKKWEELKKGDSIYMLIDRNENLQKFSYCAEYVEEELSNTILTFKFKISEIKPHNPYKMDTPYIEIKLEDPIIVEKARYDNLDSETPHYFVLTRNDVVNQKYYRTIFNDYAATYYGYEKPCYIFKSKEDMMNFMNNYQNTIKTLVRAYNKAFDEIDKKIEEL